LVSETAVIDALRAVKDPELNQSIVDLHMVRQVDVSDDGQVGVDIALTVAGCPLHHRIQQDVERVLQDLAGVRGVAINLSVMNEEERRQAFAAAFRMARPGGTEARPPERPRAQAGERIPVRSGPAPAAGPAMLDPTTKTRLIGIASGKGGVGKSTVTANLAVALARLGHRVGVMDMDIYGFSQGRLFGVEGEPEVTPDQKIIPWEAHGVKLVSMGMFVPEDQAIIWRGPMLGKMMQQFFSDVAWGDLDYLLIDLPPGTGDVALDMAQKVNHAHLVVVTTPQPVATQVATRTAALAQRTGQHIIGVIENMSYIRCPHGDELEVFGRGGGQSLAAALKVPLLGRIPLESDVREGGDTGEPIVLARGDSEAGQVFLGIAEKIQGLL
jgi:ATP-binding protein involved in chromosome partitioning